MTIQDFVTLNRKRIDREIMGKAQGSVIDDKERILWVRNVDVLRQLAKQCGVYL
jgi:hypothetical protein